MSRLYTTTDTDTIKTRHGARADKIMSIATYYGSRDDSHFLASLDVNWQKDVMQPSLVLQIMEDTHVVINVQLFRITTRGEVQDVVNRENSENHN